MSKLNQQSSLTFDIHFFKTIIATYFQKIGLWM